MKSASAIAFDHRPSRRLALAAATIVCAAIAAPWFSALPFAARIALSIVVCASGAISLRRFLRTPFRRIAYRVSGWTLLDANDREHTALLRSHVRLGAWICLDFRLDRSRRFRAMLGPDNLNAEARRRLVLLCARAEVVQAG